MTYLPEAHRIDHQIVDLVQKHWNTHGTPLLLSQLGAQIPREDAAEIKSESENLATYLRDRLADRTKIIQSVKNPTVVAAIPANVRNDPSIDIDTMLVGTQRRPVLPRFHPAFWAAFVKEPVPQTRRYISVGPPPRFQEISSESAMNDVDATEVTNEYIVGTDVDVLAVHSSIKRWLFAHGLNEGLFVDNGEPWHKQLPSDDLLGKLIMALAPEELKRMSIPLDIVSKLRRQSA